MKATLAALEDAWATREGTADSKLQGLTEELDAAKALAAQAMRESDEVPSRPLTAPTRLGLLS